VAIALGSYTVAFALNTASFAALLAALAALRLPAVLRPGGDDGGTIWARIRTGARASRREPGVRAAIVAISVVALTASPFIALIPAMARVRHDGGSALTSIFVTSQGVGAVAGALLVPGLAHRIGQHRLLLAGLVALPAALVAYGLAPTPATASVALALVGATYICVFSGIGTVVQLRAPAVLRGRVISLYFLALGTFYPVGSTIQGPLADRFGLGSVTVGAALVLLLAVVLARALRPEWLRALDGPAAYPGPVGEGAGAGGEGVARLRSHEG
jgi:predicted MFS family arabinose efflux permease